MKKKKKYLFFLKNFPILTIGFHYNSSLNTRYMMNYTPRSAGSDDMRQVNAMAIKCQP